MFNQKIVGAILVLLKHHQTIKEAIVCSTENTLANFVSKFLIKLSDIELFTQIMEICPITDIEIEVLLMQIRKILLLERKKLLLNRRLLRFQCKLALQCFTNEYIYVETEEETASVELIEISIQKSLLKKEKPSQYEIACLASYRSLFTYQWAKEISPQKSCDRSLNDRYSMCSASWR